MNQLKGAGPLVRMQLRRDWVLLAVTVAFLAVVPVVILAAFRNGFPTQESLDEYAYASSHTPAFAITYGVLTGSSLGEMVAWRLGFVPVILGALSVLLVLRYTRTEEQTGRTELVRASGAGRHATLAAGVFASGIVGVAVGLAMSLGLLTRGLPGSGSWLLGLSAIGCWAAFAGIGAVLAQLTTSAGAARGLAVTVLGVAFLLRGIGDVSAQTGGSLGWLSWLTPMGWWSMARPYGENRWWVLLAPLVVTIALLALAVRLAARRDLGAGLLPQRPGPAVAAPALRSPLALAWRLHRGPLISWVAGALVVGGALGGIAPGIGQIMNDSTPAAREALARIGGPGTVIDQYLTGMISMLALAAAVFAIQGALRMRVEERDGRAELLLASPVRRTAWAGGHLFFGLLGATLVTVSAAFGMGVAYGANADGISVQLPRILAAAVVYLPTAWLLAGVTFAVFGWFPRWAVAGYLLAAASLAFGWFASELGLGAGVQNLSIFNQIPQLLAGTFTATPLVVMTVGASLFIALGLVGLRRRGMPIT